MEVLLPVAQSRSARIGAWTGAKRTNPYLSLISEVEAVEVRPQAAAVDDPLIPRSVHG